MNRIIISLILPLLVVLLSCGQESSNNTKTVEVKEVKEVKELKKIKEVKKTKIKFEKIEHDFGKVVQGERVKYKFKFKNTGSENLIITEANASCGCTAPKYDKKPIPPDTESTIDVEFNSGGFSGKQIKTITIFANTEPNVIKLKIISEVEVPEKK